MSVLSSRPFIDLELEGPGGTATACTWVDTGGGSFFISGEMAEVLGVSWELQADHGEGAFGKPDGSVTIKNLPLDTGSGRTLVIPGRFHQPGYPAQAFLSARVMLGRDILFDYPGGEFDASLHGAMPFTGEELAAPRHPDTGFPRVELEIDGERLGFLLDTGATYTMVSDALMSTWLERHSDWPSTFGATRHASMGHAGTDRRRMLRVPEVRWGSAVLNGVGMIARPAGAFEGYISKLTTAPVVGALAGNVLSSFRFQLGDDVVFIDQKTDVDPRDLDGIGLAVGADGDGKFTVVCVCEAAHESTRELVQPGDALVAIDGTEVTGMLADGVARLQAGHAGLTRAVTVRRGTEELTVEVTTAAILSG